MQNLKEKDGGQTGLLILYLYTVPEGKEFVEKDRFDDMELTESYLPSGQLVCPVRVWREENRYVVEETGERAIYLSYDIPNGGAEYCERMVPELEAEKAVGKYGTMTVHRWSVYQVDNEEKAETSVWDWERGSGFCEIPQTGRSIFGYSMALESILSVCGWLAGPGELTDGRFACDASDRRRRATGLFGTGCVFGHFKSECVRE